MTSLVDLNVQLINLLIKLNYIDTLMDNLRIFSNSHAEE